MRGGGGGGGGGEVLNCVLMTGEGAGVDALCQGLVKCYADAGEPEPNSSTWTEIAVANAVHSYFSNYTIMYICLQTYTLYIH